VAEGCNREAVVAVAVEAEEPPAAAAAEDGTSETVGTADTAAAVGASKGKDEAIALLPPQPRARTDRRRHRHHQALLPTTFEPRAETLVEADLRRQLEVPADAEAGSTSHHRPRRPDRPAAAELQWPEPPRATPAECSRREDEAAAAAALPVRLRDLGHCLPFRDYQRSKHHHPLPTAAALEGTSPDCYYCQALRHPLQLVVPVAADSTTATIPRQNLPPAAAGAADGQ